MTFETATITGISEISPDCKRYPIELNSGEFAGEPGQHTAPKTDKGVKPYNVLAIDEARIRLTLRAYGTDGVGSSSARSGSDWP